MNESIPSVTFAVPGDLHLTNRRQSNYDAALQVVRQINQLLRPDFVQFIGDNVQDAENEQFQLFQELSSQLQSPWFALIGDHDICGDNSASRFQQWCGEPFGSHSLNGFRFLRLNTLDRPRLGLGADQLDWLDNEFHAARINEERVVVFQHHYPYKVCESFTGPGINRWREIMTDYRPVAIVCGHTHYFQVANNGLFPSIAVRSIGDPEGGPPGCLVVHLRGDDCALTYRTIEDRGPLILITHPRDILLATDGRHVAHRNTSIGVRIWSMTRVMRVTGIVDDNLRIELVATGDDFWSAPLAAADLTKGEHVMRIDVELIDGSRGQQTLTFYVDHTRRFTAVPEARPVVRTTAFC